MDVSNVLERWRSSKKIDLQNLKSELDILAQYECWVSYFDMFEAAISQFQRETAIECSAHALRHLVVDLDNLERAKKILAQLAKRFDLKFEELEHVIVKKIIEINDVEREAELLESAIPHLKSQREREIGNERLCMIFDKRLPRESKLQRAIGELLACNPQNIIGLRFLKNTLLQNRDWEELENVLLKLLDVLTHPEEKLRAALDLAALYLYQLGDPQSCVAVLDKYGHDRIDTSKMKFYAFEYLQDWKQCIEILDVSYTKAGSDEEKAAILLLKGKVKFQQDQIREAYISFIEAAKLTQMSLAPAEEALKLAIRLGDLGEVSKILTFLMQKEHWKSEQLERVKSLIARLDSLKKKKNE